MNTYISNYEYEGTQPVEEVVECSVDPAEPMAVSSEDQGDPAEPMAFSSEDQGDSAIDKEQMHVLPPSPVLELLAVVAAYEDAPEDAGNYDMDQTEANITIESQLSQASSMSPPPSNGGDSSDEEEESSLVIVEGVEQDDDLPVTQAIQPDVPVFPEYDMESNSFVEPQVMEEDPIQAPATEPVADMDNDHGVIQVIESNSFVEPQVMEGTIHASVAVPVADVLIDHEVIEVFESNSLLGPQMMEEDPIQAPATEPVADMDNDHEVSGFPASQDIDTVQAPVDVTIADVDHEPEVIENPTAQPTNNNSINTFMPLPSPVKKPSKPLKSRVRLEPKLDKEDSCSSTAIKKTSRKRPAVQCPTSPDPKKKKQDEKGASLCVRIRTSVLQRKVAMHNLQRQVVESGECYLMKFGSFIEKQLHGQMFRPLSKEKIDSIVATFKSRNLTPITTQQWALVVDADDWSRLSSRDEKEAFLRDTSTLGVAEGNHRTVSFLSCPDELRCEVLGKVDLTMIVRVCAVPHDQWTMLVKTACVLRPDFNPDDVLVSRKRATKLLNSLSHFHFYQERDNDLSKFKSVENLRLVRLRMRAFFEKEETGLSQRELAASRQKAEEYDKQMRNLGAFFTKDQNDDEKSYAKLSYVNAEIDEVVDEMVSRDIKLTGKYNGAPWTDLAQMSFLDPDHTANLIRGWLAEGKENKFFMEHLPSERANLKKKKGKPGAAEIESTGTSSDIPETAAAELEPSNDDSTSSVSLDTPEGPTVIDSQTVYRLSSDQVMNKCGQLRALLPKVKGFVVELSDPGDNWDLIQASERICEPTRPVHVGKLTKRSPFIFLMSLTDKDLWKKSRGGGAVDLVL